MIPNYIASYTKQLELPHRWISAPANRLFCESMEARAYPIMAKIAILATVWWRQNSIFNTGLEALLLRVYAHALLLAASQ